MKITIATIGKNNKSSPTAQLCQEYIKRTPWQVEIKEFEEKKPLPTDKLKEKEAALLLSSVDSSTIVIAMDENGKNFSSEEFAEKISSWQSQGYAKFSFMIGGAAGHGDSVKERADLKLSMGRMTWPHMMARAMLCEQIYRAFTIISSHPYHKK